MKYGSLREFKENVYKCHKRVTAALFLLCIQAKKRHTRKYMQHQVSMQYAIWSVYDCLHGKDSKSKKSNKMTAIWKLQVKISKYFICIYQGHMDTIIPNMKFLCLTLWLGGCAQWWQQWWYQCWQCQQQCKRMIM